MESILRKLVSFPTISETSNKELINYINSYLKEFNISGELIEGEKNQFNFHCIIGPKINGGIIFSGHTDVVPVDGQDWKTNPFKLLNKNNKYFGRGTCDMKGFIAVCLSIIPKIEVGKLKKPLHFIFSYDEEIGCVGIQKMKPLLRKLKPKPSFCVVGEPTEMQVINQHKGKKNFSVTFYGLESHSSLIEDGVNAINYCTEFINYLNKLQKELIDKYNNKNFLPAYPTINIGKIKGGLAVNIIPMKCKLDFEIRDTPEMESKLIILNIKKFIKNLELRMKKKSKKCKIGFKIKNNFPPLFTKDDSDIISLCLKALKKNNTSTVSFGTEAGVFSDVGFETIVCGPGSIKQAHKPNEFIYKSQLKQCEIFLLKLVDELYKK